MLRLLLQRLWSNIGTLTLAFLLAFAVWMSAVVAADPNEVRDYPAPLALEVRGLDPSLLLIGNPPAEVTVRLGAPSSLWQQLTAQPRPVSAYIDLSGLTEGEHTVDVEIESSLRPIRVANISPMQVQITLEPRAVRDVPITAQLQGQLALGFQLDGITLEPESATVIGPMSLMAQVAGLQAALDINQARESISTNVPLRAVDANGVVLSGLTIEPAEARLEVSILQSGGYRDVAVKVETIGQPASGFRVTDISVSPPVVTLFSADPQVVADLPGFVSTLPLDLTNLNDDLETRLLLDLPPGVIVVSEEQDVRVTIGIAPVESSLLLNLNVEVVGLASNRTATLSPESVSVIISGPLTMLQNLSPADIRLIVDVNGLALGTHLLEPEAAELPTGLQILSITPVSIEVVIARR
ncbi:MAG: hypothetical protein KF701_06090 [Anaerolineales bacterium]|nr:MAG: hypothetical protein KF701_06090 [Anaerolineales bacterium]